MHGRIQYVLHSMCEFFIDPRWIRRGQKDKEKEEYGLFCAVICCAQPSPPLSPHLAHHFTCPRPGLSVLEEQGRAPSPYPYPFGQFEGAAVDLEDGL
jgi:hypothetical protein